MFVDSVGLSEVLRSVRLSVILPAQAFLSPLLFPFSYEEKKISPCFMHSHRAIQFLSFVAWAGPWCLTLLSKQLIKVFLPNILRTLPRRNSVTWNLMTSPPFLLLFYFIPRSLHHTRGCSLTASNEVLGSTECPSQCFWDCKLSWIFKELTRFLIAK